MDEPFVSVVVTVRNEAGAITELLESLAVQEPPYEVLVVDSNSEDGTREIVASFAAKHPTIRLLLHGNTRGGSRNFGVARAGGDIVAFVDGDCLASPSWVAEIREAMATADVVAGRTVNIGYEPFTRLERVELSHKGFDVTYPSCNLAYRRDVFESLGGFDPHFRTAEDIDLNFRAVEHGYSIAFAPKAVVYNRTRSRVVGFLKQAFWNGYGRKQLTLKHGNLWASYSFRKLFARQMTFWGVVRLACAVLGYLTCKVREPRRPYVPPPALVTPRARPQAEEKGA
ncbi:MAG TPA: glycosyltransferase [Candidatus Thermoplasmatota archaeon]|nr:glycosyltransferase [Candidatus Thermoplasmatota archaeon]